MNPLHRRAPRCGESAPRSGAPQAPLRQPRRLVALVFTAALALTTALGSTTPSAAATAASEGAAAASSAADPAAAFDRANAAFASGDAAAAARAYREIAAAHGVSPALLFNLANAELRAGQIGAAVLAYERALALAPRDRDIAANLRQARHAASLTLPEPGPWEQLVARLGVDEWARLASAGLVLACFAAVLIVGLRGSEARAGARRAARAAVLLGMSTALVGALASRAALRRLERGVAVVEAALRIAPYPAATAAGRVKSGELVDVDRVHEGYALVRTDDGHSGWLASGEVQRIGDGLLVGSDGAQRLSP